MIKVWHRVHPTFMCDLADVRKAWSTPGEYELVATIDGIPAGFDEKEGAFYLTNSITEPWTGNPEVKAVRTHIRSTSTGDIVETSDGRLMVVAALGWEQLTLTQGVASGK